MDYTPRDRSTRYIIDTLSLTETEETWDKIAAAVNKLDTLLRQHGGSEPQPYADLLRSLSSPINQCMASERSRLSGAAMDMICAAATELGQSFEPLLPLFLPTLLTLCGRPNKVFVTRARTCITAFIESTQSPHILSYLLRYSKDKSTSLRLAVAEATLACLQSFNPPDLQRETRAQEIEALIKSTAKDANADIRKVGRMIFEAYAILLPGRVDRFITPLTPTIRKYLAVTNRSTSNAPSNPPSRPSSSMSTRSALTSSQSSSFVPDTMTTRRAVRKDEAPSKQAKPRRNQDSETDLPAVAGPSRAPSRQAGDVERQARRPASRADAVHTDIDTMPPPTIVPSRPRRDGAVRTQDLEPHSSTHPTTSLDLPRARAGPIRPTALHQQGSADSVLAQAEQTQADSKRSAGGARRVLRPEPSTSNHPSQTQSESTPATETVKTAPMRVAKPAPSQDKRIPERGVTSAPSSRAAAKSSLARSQTTLPRQGASMHAPKPAANQEPCQARADPRSTANERRPSSRTTASSRTVATIQSQSKTVPRQKSSATLKSRPKADSRVASTVTSRSTRRGVSPALVPLPSSPMQSRPQTPCEDASPVPDEVPSHPAAAQSETLEELSRTPTPERARTPSPEVPSDVHEDNYDPSDALTEILGPSTPQGQSTRPERMLVEQTPISALVDSIQKGFMFTPAANPLFTVDEDEYDESSVLYERQAAGSVTWDCKPLVLSRTS